MLEPHSPHDKRATATTRNAQRDFNVEDVSYAIKQVRARVA